MGSLTLCLQRPRMTPAEVSKELRIDWGVGQVGDREAEQGPSSEVTVWAMARQRDLSLCSGYNTWLHPGLCVNE